MRCGWERGNSVWSGAKSQRTGFVVGLPDAAAVDVPGSSPSRRSRRRSPRPHARDHRHPCRWAAEYYIAPIREMLRAALPANMASRGKSAMPSSPETEADDRSRSGGQPDRRDRIPEIVASCASWRHRQSRRLGGHGRGCAKRSHGFAVPVSSPSATACAGRARCSVIDRSAILEDVAPASSRPVAASSPAASCPRSARRQARCLAGGRLGKPIQPTRAAGRDRSLRKRCGEMSVRRTQEAPGSSAAALSALGWERSYPVRIERRPRPGIRLDAFSGLGSDLAGRAARQPSSFLRSRNRPSPR